MKSKKLLVLISLIAVVVVLAVVLSTVFSVKTVRPKFYNFDGSQTIAPSDGDISPAELTAMVEGKSIIFLSKQDLLNKLNSTYKQWHAFGVVKNFPNVIEVYFVKRTAVAKINLSTSEVVYVDSFGYVTEKGENDYVIDITSAFSSREPLSAVPGSKLVFKVEENNARLNYVLDAILATWQCYVEISDMPVILGENDVFSFDSDGSMMINPRLGGIIKVLSPETELANRLIKAYSVYYSESVNISSVDWTITVYKNGRITTPSK